MAGIYSKKILLIEDEQTLADIMIRKLTAKGYDPYHATNGALGIDLAKKLNPDLVLLDMKLPDMSGYQVLETMRKEQALQFTKVIVISNSGQPVEIERALELGVKDYLIKSQFDPEEVMEKVRVQLHEEKSPVQDSGNVLENRKILIIEDDKFLRDLISQKFRNEKVELKVAVDGEQGLSLAEREKPDLILLDILLPGMDGYTILEKVRANPELKDTIVIMLSNFGQREDIEKATKLGANLFLIKAAMTLDEVVEKVKELLSKAA